MTKVTVTQATGVGVLKRGVDGNNDRWSIEINGKIGPMYYTTEQVNKIIADMLAKGNKVEVE